MHYLNNRHKEEIRKSAKYRILVEDISFSKYFKKTLPIKLKV